MPVTTLGDFWARERLGGTSIRFLKVDVEGYEYFVLQGAGDLLRRCACVQLEYLPDSFPTAGLDTSAMIKLLADAGLRASVFVNGELRPLSYPELTQLDSQHDLILTPVRS